eukprot:9472798-Pyramimonas_sp.AAC.1
MERVSLGRRGQTIDAFSDRANRSCGLNKNRHLYLWGAPRRPFFGGGREQAESLRVLAERDAGSVQGTPARPHA